MVYISDYAKKRYRSDHQYREYMKKAVTAWERRQPPLRKWAISTVKNHRHRGFKILFTAKELWLWAKDKNKCAVCDQDLTYGRASSGRTLDRINDDAVLTLNNVQVVCMACNVKKTSKTTLYSQIKKSIVTLLCDDCKKIFIEKYPHLFPELNP